MRYTVLLLFLLAGCRESDRPTTRVPEQPAPPTAPTVKAPEPTPKALPTYEEFCAKFKAGWTADQLLAAIGKPTRRDADQHGDTYYYDGAARDAVSGEPRGVKVVFRGRTVLRAEPY